ncbi:metallophosphoesterase [Micromonospora sp. WMMD812]|uniref:metallophosphoesterase n=1 Tax=Micromonospora sp. WMMD812 TaxID=3015152 RepID=UPI00248CDABF|nr:metallophosphoesterase [Micromonospora sp. WMMD812]WBB65827.1 metallophosphoesterase [Micromonospora sp. WMMD812]
MLSALAFVGVIALITGLIHLYLWKRLVRDTTTPGRWRRIGGITAAVLALLIPAALTGTRAKLHWLAWPGYLWLALMFYLLVLLVALEVPMLVARLVLRRRVLSAESTAAAPEPVLVGAAGPADPPAADAVEQPDHDRSRRLLLARGAAIFAGLTAAGITGYGVRTAFGPPQLDRVRIPLAKLPRSMDGLRIATVSDIHLGPLLGRSHTERIVAAINRLDADLVAVVGDMVDGSVAELGEAAAPLRDLRSRYGSFFVTGNHEYYSGVEEWVREVDRLGLRVLQNERLEIAARGGVLDLAGVNDPSGDQLGADAGPDYAAALGDRDPSRPVVLLAHQPVAAVEAAKFGVDLQLSGHTHGGQMVPFDLAVRLEQPVVSGLGEVDGTKVYVTNGAGFWGPPVRVGANPQITLVELRTP